MITSYIFNVKYLNTYVIRLSTIYVYRYSKIIKKENIANEYRFRRTYI